MISGWIRRARARLLWRINTRACRTTISTLDDGTLKSYIVVTPHLTHLAPLATLNHSDSVQPVFVANGLQPADIAWLREKCPDTPVIPLKASLGNNPGSLLTHGVIIDYLAETNGEAFCIQDADCFVFDRTFWNSVILDPASEYAVCAFVRKGKGDRPDFPETFLTCLNAPLLRKYRARYGISADSTKRPPARARQILAEAGYPEGRVLETLKDYYDTLQQFWVVATHHGFTFRKIEGEGQTVHHIGGTSYLYRSVEDLAHWDYWPLAVHYFNLKILEMPGCARFRERFATIIDFHGSSASLLNAYPDFATGRRRKAADDILEGTNADAFFADSAVSVEPR